MNTTFTDPFFTTLLDHITDAVLFWGNDRNELVYWNRPAEIILNHAGFFPQKKESILPFLTDRFGCSFNEFQAKTCPLNGFVILEQGESGILRLFEYVLFMANSNGSNFSILILKPRLLEAYTDKYPVELIGNSFLTLLHSEEGGDSLTALPDRNVFRRYWRTLRDNSDEKYLSEGTLLFCDLYHFKQINDLRGHQAGDDILIRVARLFEEIFQAPDLPTRYGGDEFIVLCPNSNLEQTENKFLQYQIKLRQLSLTGFLPEEKIQMNYGLASYSSNSNLDDIIRQADNDYYRRKYGRNVENGL